MGNRYHKTGLDASVFTIESETASVALVAYDSDSTANVSLTLSPRGTGEVEVTKTASSANTESALKITCNNSGSGSPAAIDMSTFSVDEALFVVPSDAITSAATAGAASHQIAVEVSGVTRYIYLYTHGLG